MFKLPLYLKLCEAQCWLMINVKLQLDPFDSPKLGFDLSYCEV